MKSLNQIMKELGFEEKGTRSVQEAFIKHLIKQTMGVDVQTPTEKKFKSSSAIATESSGATKKNDVKAKSGEQLSFDFYGDEGGDLYREEDEKVS